MPKVSVDQKGTAPDSSDYIAFKRRQAVLRAQLSKTPALNQTQKPIIGREFHLQKGFESGVVDLNFTKGKILDQSRFNF